MKKELFDFCKIKVSFCCSKCGIDYFDNYAVLDEHDKFICEKCYLGD